MQLTRRNNTVVSEKTYILILETTYLKTFYHWYKPSQKCQVHHQVLFQDPFLFSKVPLAYLYKILYGSSDGLKYYKMKLIEGYMINIDSQSIPFSKAYLAWIQILDTVQKVQESPSLSSQQCASPVDWHTQKSFVQQTHLVYAHCN